MVKLVQVRITNYYKVTISKLSVHKAIVADLSKSIISRVVAVSNYTRVSYFDLVRLGHNTNTPISFEAVDKCFKLKTAKHLVSNTNRLILAYIEEVVIYSHAIAFLC